nr:hypothetical protein [Candidatus Gracilibacteria bacterium]
EYMASVRVFDYSLALFLRDVTRPLRPAEVAKLIETVSQTTEKSSKHRIAVPGSEMTHVFANAVDHFWFSRKPSDAKVGNADYVLECCAVGHKLLGKELVNITYDEWFAFAATESSGLYDLYASQLLAMNVASSGPNAGNPVFDFTIFKSFGYNGPMTPETGGYPALRAFMMPKMQAFLAWLFFSHAQVAHLRSDIRSLLADRESMLPQAARRRKTVRSVTQEMVAVTVSLRDGQSLAEMQAIVAGDLARSRDVIPTEDLGDFEAVNVYVAANGMPVVLYSNGLQVVLRFPKVETVAHQTYTTLQGVLMSSGRMNNGVLTVPMSIFSQFQGLWRTRRLAVQNEIVLAAQRMRANQLPDLLDGHFEDREKDRGHLDAALNAATAIGNLLRDVTGAVSPDQPKVTPLRLLAVRGRPTWQELSGELRRSMVGIVSGVFLQPKEDITDWRKTRNTALSDARDWSLALSAFASLTEMATHLEVLRDKLSQLIASPYFEAERITLQAVAGVLGSLDLSTAFSQDQHILLEDYLQRAGRQLYTLISLLTAKQEQFPHVAGNWVSVRGAVSDCHATVFDSETADANHLFVRFGLDDENERRWAQWRAVIEAAVVSNPGISEDELVRQFFSIFAPLERVPPLPKLYPDHVYASPDEGTVGSIEGRPNMMSIQFQVEGGALFELTYVLGRLDLRQVDTQARRKNTIVSM